GPLPGGSPLPPLAHRISRGPLRRHPRRRAGVLQTVLRPLERGLLRRRRLRRGPREVADFALLRGHPRRGTRADAHRDGARAALPRTSLAWRTPALFAPGDAELDLWSNVLSEGKSSRLFHPLVYEQKVAKDVFAFQVSQKLSSFYVIAATAAPGVDVDRLHT